MQQDRKGQRGCENQEVFPREYWQMLYLALFAKRNNLHADFMYVSSTVKLQVSFTDVVPFIPRGSQLTYNMINELRERTDVAESITYNIISTIQQVTESLPRPVDVVHAGAARTSGICEQCSDSTSLICCRVLRKSKGSLSSRCIEVVKRNSTMLTAQ